VRRKRSRSAAALAFASASNFALAWRILASRACLSAQSGISPAAAPEPNAQRNFTDPESRILKTKDTGIRALAICDEAGDFALPVRSELWQSNRARKIEHEELSMRFLATIACALVFIGLQTAQSPAEPAAEVWATIKDTTSIAILEEFQRHYPGSVYADFARARVDELRKASRTASCFTDTRPLDQPVIAPSDTKQRALLYEEEPTDPNGRRFVGSAAWHTEIAAPGPGDPLELALRADVEVPERNLAMTLSLRRNTEKALPASHAFAMKFKLPAEYPEGGIFNVPGILMKAGEQNRGVSLTGSAKKVSDGFFLFVLSTTQADKDRNQSMLRECGWIDIPIVYNTKRRAILALEKGTSGDRIFAEAFKTWDQQTVPR
jgi:hypothetical protein